MKQLMHLADIGRHIARARWRWSHLSQAELAAYQAARARHIIAYAQQHAPFYRQHWHGHDLADWQALPTFDKQLMMQHFTDTGLFTFIFDHSKRRGLYDIAIGVVQRQPHSF